MGSIVGGGEGGISHPRLCAGAGERVQVLVSGAEDLVRTACSTFPHPGGYKEMLSILADQ
jgi:hypothetical protein